MSSAWIGLLKKEFRLGLMGGTFLFLLSFVCLAFGGLMAWKYQEPAILLVISIVALAGHIFYMPTYILFSLQSEKTKMHLWLHSVQPGTNLLLSKLLNGLFAMMVSLLIPMLIILIILLSDMVSFLGFIHYTWYDIVQNVCLIAAYLIGSSLYITLWIILIWVIYRTLIPFFGKMSWLITALIVIIGSMLMFQWESSSLYTFLTNWGAIQIPFDRFAIHTQGSGMGIDTGFEKTVFVGSYVYYTAVAVLVFLVSSWLLDHKVEV